MTSHMHNRFTLGQAWLALTLALVLHVVDEAANDFLALYNPVAQEIRSGLGLPFPPALEFGTWLAGLVLVLAILLLLSVPAAAEARFTLILAFPYSVLMFGNGAAHITVSVISGRFVAGVYSSPILILCAVLLFAAALRTYRTRGVQQHSSLH